MLRDGLLNPRVIRRYSQEIRLIFISVDLLSRKCYRKIANARWSLSQYVVLSNYSPIKTAYFLIETFYDFYDISQLTSGVISKKICNFSSYIRNFNGYDWKLKGLNAPLTWSVFTAAFIGLNYWSITEYPCWPPESFNVFIFCLSSCYYLKKISFLFKHRKNLIVTIENIKGLIVPLLLRSH